MLGWDPYRFDKKRFRTLYAELLFSHPVGSTGIVVHSSASGARNIDVLFSYSGGTGMDSIKIMLGHVTSNFCFCILWDMRVIYCISVRLGSESSAHYFSCSGGTDTGLTKSASGHVTLTFCFCVRWDLRVM
jgi:hypothetical protein